MNRRPSYASVASGLPASSNSAPTRSGAFAHLISPSSTLHTSHTQEGGRQVPAMQRRTNNTHDGATSTIPAWSKSSATGNYWNHATQVSHGTNGTAQETWVRPSYLRHTRYMQKLEDEYQTKTSRRQDSVGYIPQATNQGSLSASPSSVSLHRLAPSHRGMTYDVVEKAVPIEEEHMPQLPSQLKEHDRGDALEISPNGLELRCVSIAKSQDHEAAAGRADFAIPPQCGIYYYEVSILSQGKEGMVGIGFDSKSSLDKLPGWDSNSWGYHGDDGKSFCCQVAGKAYGPKFTAGDVVGCGINFRTSTAFFTRNGVSQGDAFRDLNRDMPLYPLIGMKRLGTHVKVNFGQSPFMYDIEGLMNLEMGRIKEDIALTDISTLRPPLDESSLIKELVAQFLRHDGYVETAKTFADETRDETRALARNLQDIPSDYDLQQDIDAVNRQHIRGAILDGDIDKALKRTNVFYPNVLDSNPDIYFRLRCRKFVEMMRLSSEPHVSSRTKDPNGRSSSGGVFEQDMELDEPNVGADEWDRMDTEETESRTVGSLQHMNETLRYGSDLQKEYKDDKSKDAAFKEIFSLFAYDDPRNSPAAHVMDPSGRLLVAEELNSAILVSLGKSSAAAIERICQQTDVLLADLGDRGGPGAFVNIHHDILR